MAEKNISSKPKKRRWYQNLKDAFTMTKRVYPWLGWALGGTFVAFFAIFLIIGLITGRYIYLGAMGLALGLISATALLTFFSRKAMYVYLDGRQGAVYQILGQIKRNWNIEEQPAGFNSNQDLVWRMVGSPGIVLISEGPSSRVTRLLNDERKKAKRVAPDVPVILIQCGNEPNQVPLNKLLREIKKKNNSHLTRIAAAITRKKTSKSVLSRYEVPVITNRLKALQTKNIPMPKGIDPTKVKMNRRALRGN